MLLKLTIVTWFLFFVVSPIMLCLVQTMSDDEMTIWKKTNKLPRRCKESILIWLALGICGVLFTVLTVMLW